MRVREASGSSGQMNFSLLRMLSFADLLTLGNSACGVMSIFNSILYNTTQDSQYTRDCILLLFLSLLFDVFDGKIARLFSHSLIGKDLDSLADVVSFGVAPAVFGFCHGLNSRLDIIILVFFVNCGVLRLARYNSTVQENSKDGKVVFFEGTPIPSTVLIPTLIYFQFFTMEFWGLHLGSLVYLLSGVLQASKRIKIRKL